MTSRISDKSMQASEELGKKVTDNKNLNKNPQKDTNTAQKDGAASEASKAQEINPDSQESAELTNLQQEVEKLKQESSDNYNKFVRAMADMDNIKRRTEKEKSDIRQYALESFLKEMLPILDSFNQATDDSSEKDQKEAEASKGEKGKSFFEGMLMVKRQLNETLEKHGLAGIDAKGAPFDPNLHQAISKVESNEIDQEIVKDEYSKGYTLNGRLLRPAMVSVMVPSESN
ncbi:MAG: nucleotide exchange factor GrpE [Oligoflexales bacterium]|nr:nucleotide exchange factor GrpE [Oligoflexales bacterium]